MKDLKYVVGSASKDEPAIIRFFGSVNACTTQQFNEEFLWLQNVIQPSKIVVLINSDGGSVVDGMSTFSIIQSCPIEVDCIIEGIAASMGSVIWSAGKNLYMHDYSILMIHNPFLWGADTEDANTQQITKAFKTQLETIYHKRLGLPIDTVRQIMDGEENCDGTFFNAKDAVKAGIITSKNVIKTPKQIFDKITHDIEGVVDAISLRDIMAAAISEADQNKLIETIVAIPQQNQLNIQNNSMEKEKMSFGAVAAQLGFSADVAVADVAGRINELLNTEKAQAEIQAKLDNLTIQFTAKEAEIKNLSDELSEVKASLQSYKDAEAAAFQAEVEKTVDAAIEAGKIEASAKENWIEMASKNFDMVKSALDSIQGREKITQEIADDPANTQRMQDELKSAEEKMAEKVASVIGEVNLQTF